MNANAITRNFSIKCRVMYPSVHTQKVWKSDQAAGKEPKYELTLVVPQNDPVIQQIVDSTAQIVAQELDGAQPSADNYPLKVDEKNQNVQGHYVIHARNKFKPQVLYADGGAFHAITDPSVPADGDWCVVEIRLYNYTKPRAGVGVSLEKVLYFAPGQGALGNSGTSNEEAFGQHLTGAQVPNMAPQAQPVAQPAAQPPMQQPVAQPAAQPPMQQPAAVPPGAAAPPIPGQQPPPPGGYPY